MGPLGRFGNGLSGAIGAGMSHAVLPALTAGAAAVGDALYEAGKLQSILVSTQNITGANRAQMNRARLADFSVGNMAGMAPVTTAEMFRELARQSQGSMSFEDMESLLPRMAKMQVVLGNARGFSAAQTTDATMALTHLFRAYDPRGQGAMMDTVLRMGELMPTNLTQAVTSMGYFEPTLKNLHVKDQDAAALMVAISRFGLGRGKGGTSIQNLFSDALGPLQLTAHAQRGKSALLGPGMLDVTDASGKSRFFNDKSGDPMGFLMQLSNFAQSHGSTEAQRVFEGAFGKQGSRVADLMADPVIVNQLKRIEDAVVNQRSLGLDSQSNTIFATANQARKRFGADWQALASEIGTLALPGITRGLNDLSNGLHTATNFLLTHGALEKKISAEIVGYVAGAERWVATHHSTFRALENDLELTFKVANRLAPQLATVADGFSVIALDLNHVTDALQGFDRWAASGNIFAKALRMSGAAGPSFGLLGTDPRQPLDVLRREAAANASAVGGNTTVNHHYNVQVTAHGPVNGQRLGRDIVSGIKATMNSHGAAVTHARTPLPLSVRQH
jgi:hypothetical protein